MKKLVLLVEDNPDDVDLTLYALKKNDFKHEVFVVNDGVEALEYLFGTGTHKGRDMSVMPEIVLLDLKLPRINGIEVLQRLRDAKETKHLPVVILTSSKEERDVINCYRRGANAYVRKPVDFNEFVSAVKHILSFWLILNVPCRGKGV